MYKIEKTGYGIRLTFGGTIPVDEMKTWIAESLKILKSLPPKFCVFVDMRELKPLKDDSQLALEEGQKMYKKAGLERSVVILASSVLTMQLKRTAKETGIYEWERYIDASKTANWEEAGQKWLVNKINPDN